MMTQTDLFDPAGKIDDGAANETESQALPADASPIAVPCGFMDRHNSRCQRLGNWPVMADGKQMVCRGRPMLHCDPACFRGDTPAQRHIEDNDDIDWSDREGAYGDEQMA